MHCLLLMELRISTPALPHIHLFRLEDLDSTQEKIRKHLLHPIQTHWMMMRTMTKMKTLSVRRFVSASEFPLQLEMKKKKKMQILMQPQQRQYLWLHLLCVPQRMDLLFYYRCYPVDDETILLLLADRFVECTTPTRAKRIRPTFCRRPLFSGPSQGAAPRNESSVRRGK